MSATAVTSCLFCVWLEQELDRSKIGNALGKIGVLGLWDPGGSGCRHGSQAAIAIDKISPHPLSRRLPKHLSRICPRKLAGVSANRPPAFCGAGIQATVNFPWRTNFVTSIFFEVSFSSVSGRESVS